MIRRFNRTILCIMAASIFAHAPGLHAHADSEYPSDSRIKILRYDASDIFTIYTLYGYQTNIEFSRSEEVQTISVGDRSLWQIIPAGNRLFIRPMDDNVSTNMTVISNMRTYQFDLKSGSGKLEDNPRMLYVARFTYPDKNAQAAYVPAVQTSPITPVISSPETQVATYKPLLIPPPAAPLTSIKPLPPEPRDPVVAPAPKIMPAPELAPQSAPALAAPEPMEASTPVTPKIPSPSLNRLYTYSGPDDLAPMQVYDDGHTTYFKFANRNDLPTMRIIAADGMATPVSYTVRDGIASIDTVTGSIMLSYGNQKPTVYIYNEGMNPEDAAHGE